MLQQGPRAPSCSSTASRALGVAFTPHIPPGDSLGRGNTPHLQWGTDHRACLTKLATWEARRLCSSVCKLHLKSSMCVCAYVCECHTLTHVHARTHKHAHSLHQRHPGRLLRGHGHSLCPGPSAPTPGPGPRPGRAMRPCQVDSCPAPGPPRRRPLAALCVNAPPAEGRLPTIWPGVDCWQPVTAPQGKKGSLRPGLLARQPGGSAEPAGGVGGRRGRASRPLFSHRHPGAPSRLRPPPPRPTPPGGNGVACCYPGRCSRPAPAGEAGTGQTLRKAGGRPGSAPCPMPALSPGVLLTAAGLGSRTP